MALQRINWTQIDTVPPSGSVIGLGSQIYPLERIYANHLDILGSINVGEGGITGSLFGTSSYSTQAKNSYTASYVLQAVSSSFATSASFSTTSSYAIFFDTGSLLTTSSFNTYTGLTISNFAGTSSYAQLAKFALTASYVKNAQTSSYVENAQTASYVKNAQTSSYIENAQTASYVLNSQTASYVKNAVSSSYSEYAKFALNGGGGPGGGTPGGDNTQIQYNNDGLFGGVPTLLYDGTTLSATGTFTGSLRGTATTASYVKNAQTASYVLNSQTASYVLNAVSSSFASTSSFLENNIDFSGSLRLYVSPMGSDTNDGTQPTKPFKTIKAAVASLGVINPFVPKRYTIYVGSGEYEEINPITVPPGVAIIGDSLRTVRLTAKNPNKDYFHCHESTYFYGLRFIDLKHPSFVFSFPCSTATGTTNVNGGVETLTIVHSATGYTGNSENIPIGILIEEPDLVSGTTRAATANANISNGVITGFTITYSGSGYSMGEKFHISIPAPEGQRPFISASPYVQNCSSITGPFTLDGTKISVRTPLPYDINFISGSSIDPQGAGGGIRIDGNCVNEGSPLQSFVADAFTQVNQGGPGHLVINNGYAQFVSCFTTFCTYGFKVAAGGYGNISNSVCDFGNFGLISKKNFPTSYNTAIVDETKTSYVNGVTLSVAGSGYTGSSITLQTTGGGGTGATVSAKIVNTSIAELSIISAGTGYTSAPTLVFPPPTLGGTSIQATGTTRLSGVSEILMTLSLTGRSVDISSNMSYDGVNYLVTGVAPVTGRADQRRITVFPSPNSVVSPSGVTFTQLSNISTGGLVMEYVGAGVTYNALPKFGGIPNDGKEVSEISPGKVFYATVDNIGNLKIGKYFKVNQLTGEVKITSDTFSLAGIASIGPFKRNGFDVGVTLNEVSDSSRLENSGGNVASDTVPTQNAVKNYIYNTLNDSKVIRKISTNELAGNTPNTDYIYLVTGTNTITLPSAVGNRNTYTIKRVGNGTVTILTSNGQTMDGSTSITLYVQYGSVNLVSDGDNWNLI